MARHAQDEGSILTLGGWDDREHPRDGGGQFTKKAVAYSKTLKLKVAAATLGRWRLDEYTSWEDSGTPIENHVYSILGRHEGLIEVRSERERHKLINSARYHGDAGGWNDAPAYRAAVGRIAERLRSRTEQPL